MELASPTVETTVAQAGAPQKPVKDLRSATIQRYS
jgi:hypothetical protein